MGLYPAYIQYFLNRLHQSSKLCVLALFSLLGRDILSQLDLNKEGSSHREAVAWNSAKLMGTAYNQIGWSSRWPGLCDGSPESSLGESNGERAAFGVTLAEPETPQGSKVLMKQWALTESSHMSLSSSLLLPLHRESKLGPYAMLSVAMNCSHLLLREWQFKYLFVCLFVFAVGIHRFLVNFALGILIDLFVFVR